MTVLKLATLMIVIALSTAACTDESKELSAEEKYAVDTIFNRQINSYHNYLDSVCKAQRDSFYRIAVDSIKKERIAEIEMFMFEIDSLP